MKISIIFTYTDIYVILLKKEVIMKICNCGHSSADIARFCSNCGQQLPIVIGVVMEKNPEMHLVQCINCSEPFHAVNPVKNKKVVSVSCRASADYGFLNLETLPNSAVGCPKCGQRQFACWQWE